MSLFPLGKFPIFAIYRAGECVYASPRFFRQIEDRAALPALLRSGESLVRRAPWQILINRFVLRGKEHALVSFHPDRDGRPATVAEAEENSRALRETLGGVLAGISSADEEEYKFCAAPFLAEFEEEISNEVGHAVSFSVCEEENERPSAANPLCLTDALAILLFAYCYRDVHLTASQACVIHTPCANECRVELYLPNWTPAPFLCELAEGLTKAGGFTVAPTEQGFLFRLPAVRAKAELLRTYPKAEIFALLPGICALFRDENAGFFAQE